MKNRSQSLDSIDLRENLDLLKSIAQMDACDDECKANIRKTEQEIKLK